VTTAAPPLNIGDMAYLGSYLINTHVYGVVTPPDTPDQFAATFEIMGDQGTLMMNALVGPPGSAGQHAFALRLQTDPIDDPDDLPPTLTNSEADIGKYWLIDDLDGEGNIIGTSAYIWYGTVYRRMMMGTPGPAGPVPRITPDVTLIDPSEISYVDVGGSTFYPSWMLNLAVPPGPAGPSAALATCPDVDMSTPPDAGDVLGFTGTYTGDGLAIWKPMSLAQILPNPYSVPESAFSSFSGLSQRATIGSFAIPPQPFAWTPIIWGHCGAGGIMLSGSPLTIGVEVRLGDPVTGVLVARGFGNSLGEVNIMPHYSSGATPDTAITPSNHLAMVPPNHSTAAQGTVYVNLYNDGAAGVYQFSPPGAQLFAMVTPVV